jgi:hypothetical protein
MALVHAVCEDSAGRISTGRKEQGMRLRYGLYALGMALGLGVSGCKKEEPATVPMDVPAVPPPSDTVPREGQQAATPPTFKLLDGGGLPLAAGGPAANAGTNGGVATLDTAWTAAAVEKPRSQPPAVLMRSVRTGTHPDYDRTVFEFDGPRLPGYRVAYVKTPVQDCGSGDDVKTPGQAALEVRFTVAQAHDDQGQATVAQRSFKPALPTVQGLDRLCDFEGEVTWVLGTTREAPFRLLELKNPTRLVLDVQH